MEAPVKYVAITVTVVLAAFGLAFTAGLAAATAALRDS